MTPACLLALQPTPRNPKWRSDLAAGYLAKHAKLILVPLKPGDYGGFPLCLFVWMLNYQYVIGMCIVMWGAYSVAHFTGMLIAIGQKQDSPVTL